MLFVTHIMIGIVMFLLFMPIFGGSKVIAFALVLLGSILPDIDERHSKMNQWSGFIGKIVVMFVKHRGIFHSMVFHIGIGFLVAWYFGVHFGVALFIGYLAHLIGDGITPMGVKLFYPLSNFKVKGPIRVGSYKEKIIMFVLFIAIIGFLRRFF
jgi:inner membrane protein